eukprot:1116514-Amorphochlora_amoeboformis.AAC.1
MGGNGRLLSKVNFISLSFYPLSPSPGEKDRDLERFSTSLDLQRPFVSHSLEPGGRPHGRQSWRVT